MGKLTLIIKMLIGKNWEFDMHEVFNEIINVLFSNTEATVEVWKTIGVIVSGLLTVTGAFFLYLRNKANDNLNLVFEKQKNYFKDLVSDIQSKDFQRTSAMSDLRLEIFNKVAIYNDSVEKTVKEFSEQVSKDVSIIGSKLTELSVDIAELSLETKGIKNELRELQTAQTNVSDFESSLRENLSNSVAYYNVTIPVEVCVRQFAVMKTELFIEFAVEFREVFLGRGSFEHLLEKGRSVAQQIKRNGYAILGKEFVDIFYIEHEDTTEKFFEELKNIFNDKANRKVYHFQIACEQFVRRYLQILQRCYNEYKDSICCED